jgi:hypothetical protein
MKQEYSFPFYGVYFCIREVRLLKLALRSRRCRSPLLALSRRVAPFRARFSR